MGVHKALFVLILVAAAWLGVKYLLPLLFPFLLGLGLALCAQPAVKLGTRKLGLSRGFASALGVSLTLLLLLGLLFLLGALLFRELMDLLQGVPDTVRSSTVVLEDWLVQLSDSAPEGVRPYLTDTVHRLFSDSDTLLRQAAGQLPGMATQILGKLPGSAMGLGTGVVSAYLISPRLPRLRQWITRHLPPVWKEKLQPALTRLRLALKGWLKAQLRLMGITFCIVTVGFLILGIPYAPVSAAGVALVDAVPLLGTGAVLLPWALVELLQGRHFRAVGLLCTYAAASMTRTVMEPRLVGKRLGLDPLVMLVFLYLGFKFLGFWGIVISPMLAFSVKTLMEN